MRQRFRTRRKWQPTLFVYSQRFPSETFYLFSQIWLLFSVGSCMRIPEMMMMMSVKPSRDTLLSLLILLISSPLLPYPHSSGFGPSNKKQKGMWTSNIPLMHRKKWNVAWATFSREILSKVYHCSGMLVSYTIIIETIRGFVWHKKRH